MRTIAWDVDDVLNDLMKCWLDQEWIPAHPWTVARYDDLTANPPHVVLGCELAEYLESLDRFRQSECYARLRPVPEILDWFNRFGSGFRHIAVTSVPLRGAPSSAEWVVRHFGRWIRSYHFIPSPRVGENLPSYDSDKMQFLAWFRKVDIFVDDHPGHVVAARSMGCKATLMPRPWNARQETIADAMKSLQTI